MTPHTRRKIWSAVLIVGFFVLWEALCWLFNVSDIVVPKPSQIIVTLYQRGPALWPHTVQTLYTTLVGFGFGIVIGIALGVLIGSSRLAYDVAYPLLVGFASIPKVAVVPIFVLWFGSGTVPAVLTAMIMCIFPIVVNVATGLATTEPELEDVMRALRATKTRHSVECRPAAHHAVLLRLAESVGDARLRRHGHLGDRGVEPRHRQRHDDRVVELRRAVGLCRTDDPRLPRRRPLRDLLADRIRKSPAGRIAKTNSRWVEPSVTAMPATVRNRSCQCRS